MTIRKTMYEALITDATLIALVPAERWLERGSVVDVPSRPYVVHACLGTAPVSGRNAWVWGVWVHDERGDFNRIDDVLTKVQARLTGLQQFVGTDGRLVQADWQSTSEDGFDDATNTNVKQSTYQIVGVRNG
jgi:hypothetical protein